MLIPDILNGRKNGTETEYIFLKTELVQKKKKKKDD